MSYTSLLSPRNLFLFIGLPLCLLYIWLPHYFLTGDGPCHVYNAHLLQQFWQGKDIAFYSRFFEVSDRPNPNWISHVLLAGMMYVVNGAVAEKILVTAIVLVFATGAFAVLQRLSGQATYWVLLLFLFVFHHLLVMGFYNFSLSVGFFFWLTELWMRYLDTRKYSLLLLFIPFTLVTYFTHPLAFIFGLFTCFALTLSYNLSVPGPRAAKLRSLAMQTLLLTACYLPASYFLFRFITRDGSGGLVLKLYQYRLRSFLESNFMVSYLESEAPVVMIISILLAIMFCIGLVLKVRKKVIERYDGFLLGFLFAAFIYKCFPDELFGGASVIIRAHLFVYLYMVCCIAYMIPAGKFKNAMGLLFFAGFLGLSFLKISVVPAAGAAADDYLSAAKFIKPGSVVFPLDFAPDGRSSSGARIADRVYLFSHAPEYMGLQKPIVFTDNYEGNTGYFPINWKGDVNPYNHLGKFEGIEGWPPYAEIAEYKKTTGVTIDYILMWCYNPSYLSNEHFKTLYSEIGSMYHLIYTSPTGHTTLFVKNQ